MGTPLRGVPSRQRRKREGMIDRFLISVGGKTDFAIVEFDGWMKRAVLLLEGAYSGQDFK